MAPLIADVTNHGYSVTCRAGVTSAKPHDPERMAAAEAKRKRKLEKLLNTPQAKARRLEMEKIHEAAAPQTYPEIPDDRTEFKSCAEWPEGTFSLCNNTTRDTHATAEAAEAVCMLLRRNGAGGEGKVFPIRTWVE